MTPRGSGTGLAALIPDEARRVALTVSCADTDDLPKVERAGEVVDRDGTAVQVMHNGVVVEEGCYYGPWMTEIIRALRGHHEPQEELVFHHVLERLAASNPRATMLELGSFWAYYSLWFHQVLPLGRIVAVEPDPVYLEVGRRNFELNGWADAATFVQGALGPAPGELAPFRAESTDELIPVPQHDLASLMALTGWERVDLLLADVQGAEDVLLERAADQLAKRVRFLVVSTHHHTISGDPLTHQKALARLRAAGAHVIAEHTVGESFSGDGLIAVSFDERDADLVVPVSRARAAESLYGEPEVELDRAWQRADGAEQRAADAEHRLERAEQERDALSAARAAANDQPTTLEASWTGRLAARARRVGRATDPEAPAHAVRWGYRYLFGREPEDDGIVRAHAEELGDWHQVRAYLMASPEYAGRAGARSTMSGLEPPMALSVDADPATTDALLDHIADTWSQLGVTEPHYSVVTNDAFRRESFAADEADFYDSGTRDVERMLATFARNGLSPRTDGCWLELGCGVGRMTPSLAAHAGQLIAMDVSPAHLELARQQLAATRTDNVELRRLTHVKDLDELPDLDVFFSLIVLQHNPPPVMLAILERIFARFAPGGVAYFQVPTYRHDYRFVLDEYLRTAALASEMEMHVLPQREVLRAATTHGLEPVEIWEDGSTGLRPGEVSNTFLLHKP